MTLYIIRHGETEENLRHILQGHLPGVLTAEGRRQMSLTAERLQQSGVEYGRIVSSDLQRALDSAAIVGERLQLAVEPMTMLRERDWGSFTGISVSEAQALYHKDGKWCFPITDRPVESEAQLKERADEVLRLLKERYVDENVIVVTHGLFSRFLVAARFGCSYREVTHLVNAEVRPLSL